MGMLSRSSAIVSILLVFGEALRFAIEATSTTPEMMAKTAIAAAVLLGPPVILLYRERAGILSELGGIIYPLFLGGGFLIAHDTAHPLAYELCILTIMMPLAALYSLLLLLGAWASRSRTA